MLHPNAAHMHVAACMCRRSQAAHRASCWDCCKPCRRSTRFCRGSERWHGVRRRVCAGWTLVTFQRHRSASSGAAAQAIDLLRRSGLRGCLVVSTCRMTIDGLGACAWADNAGFGEPHRRHLLNLQGQKLTYPLLRRLLHCANAKEREHMRFRSPTARRPASGLHPSASGMVTVVRHMHMPLQPAQGCRADRFVPPCPLQIRRSCPDVAPVPELPAPNRLTMPLGCRRSSTKWTTPASRRRSPGRICRAAWLRALCGRRCTTTAAAWCPGCATAPSAGARQSRSV